MGWFTKSKPAAEEKRREKAAEQERQRKHRKLFEDYANDLPKPGPNGIIPRRK